MNNPEPAVEALNQPSPPDNPGQPPLRFDIKYRCTALSSQTGERCKRPAIKGGSVCPAHGGRAPQVRAAANRRLERASREKLRDRLAGGSVRQLLDELEIEAGERHPIDVLINAVERAAAMTALLGVLVGELDAPQPDDGFPQGAAGMWGADCRNDGRMHVLVADYARWTELAAKTAKLALDAGVDERRLQLARGQATVLAEVVRAAAADIVEAFAAAGLVVPTTVRSQVLAQLPGIMRRRLESHATPSTIDAAIEGREAP